MNGGGTTGSGAGASAYEEAARSRMNAARRAAEAARLTEEAARLTAQAAEASRKAGYHEQRGASFETGAEGEQATGRVLDSLRSEGWIVLNDVRWPGRTFANIDHIAVGPGGIVVIDTKNWSGRVDVRDETLRQNGHRREREVASAGEAAVAVVALLPADLHSMVRPVICLARNEWVDATARGVQIASTATLANFLRGLGQVLTASAVGRAVQALERSLVPRASTTAPSAAQSVPQSVKFPPQRSIKRRQASQTSRRPAGKGTRKSKRKQQSIVPLAFAVAVLLLFLFAPTTFRSTLQWLSETVGGVVADAVIPEPSTTPTSPAPSAR